MHQNEIETIGLLSLQNAGLEDLGAQCLVAPNNKLQFIDFNIMY